MKKQDQQFFKELKQEIVEEVGVLINQKITTVVGQAVGGLREEMNQRFDQTDAKIDAAVETLAMVAKKGFDETRHRIDGLENTMRWHRMLLD